MLERTGKDGSSRYIGMYRAKDGSYKSAGTYDDHERAIEVAEQGEAPRMSQRHVLGPPLRNDRPTPSRLRPSASPIEEHNVADDDLLFPQWMFAYQRITTPSTPAEEPLPPLVSKTGLIYEHGTKSARYGMNCTCRKCKDFAADYQRRWRRQKTQERAANGTLTKANIWRQDGTEFLSPETWNRFWHHARETAGLPNAFTAYNARHTGISWAIAKGVDLQRVRQRAGHGSLSVTSRHAAILDEVRDYADVADPSSLDLGPANLVAAGPVGVRESG
ncbi:hypothetical protein [Actinocorallia lasiicapitis]